MFFNKFNIKIKVSKAPNISKTFYYIVRFIYSTGYRCVRCFAKQLSLKFVDYLCAEVFIKRR